MRVLLFLILLQNIYGAVSSLNTATSFPTQETSAFFKLPETLQVMPGVIAAKDRSAFMFRVKKEGFTPICFQGTNHCLPYETLCEASRMLIEAAEILYTEIGTQPYKQEALEEVRIFCERLKDTADHAVFKTTLSDDRYQKLRNAFLELAEHSKTKGQDIINQYNLHFELLSGYGLLFFSTILMRLKIDADHFQGMDEHMSTLRKEVKSLDHHGLISLIRHPICPLNGLTKEEIVGQIAYNIDGFDATYHLDEEDLSLRHHYQKHHFLDFLFELIAVREGLLDGNHCEERNQLWFEKLHAEASSQSCKLIVACGGAGHYDLLSIFAKNGYTIELMDMEGVFYPFPLVDVKQHLKAILMPA